MTGRLIVVSNRVPTEEEPSGGLVVALHDALNKTGGLWIGAHPETTKEPRPGLTKLGEGNYERMAFHLTEDEYRGYYLGYANAVLWPLCHRRTDLLTLNRADAETYVAVNHRVAELIYEIARPDDRIWVQDYHFFPLARCLRDLGFEGRIGFFLHIPFPTVEALGALPEREAFLDWQLAYDAIGLQSKRDVATFESVYHQLRGADVNSDGVISVDDQTCRVAAHPVGIDTDAFAAEAAAGEDGREMVGLRPGEQLIIGVDRLDYSKGIPGRFEAFGRYLAQRDPKSPRATFVQIAPPSRSDVPAYQEITRELETLAGSVNGEHAELDWTPLRYIHRSVPRNLLAPLYRAARVALVTPLADGMNLVAKEYVAAQDPADPGVLVLSREAGAAEDLSKALIVNPFDHAEVADAIAQALTMPLDERQERYSSMIEAVRKSDVSGWAAACLRDLDGPDRPTLSNAVAA